MLGFVVNKIWNKKWITISLIIGNILMIGLLVGNDVYSNSVLNRVLVKDLKQSMSDTGVYPLQVQLEIGMDKTRSDKSVAKKVLQLEEEVGRFSKDMQLDEKIRITSYNIRTNYLFQPKDKEDGAYVLDLSFLSGLNEHSKILSGKIYSNEIVDGAIEVIVSRKTMMEQNLAMGEEVYLADACDKEGNPYKIRVVGVFENSDETDAYWVKSPDSYSTKFYMDETLFKDMFVDYENPQYKWSSTWNVLLDYNNIKASQVQGILHTLEQFNSKIETIDCNRYEEYFGDTLKEFQTKQAKLENILFLLEIPILILLVIFIYMVNNQMMQLERGDIAMLKSRGASNLQIFRIYLLQGCMIAGVGLGFGIPLGLMFCKVLGNANAFLKFVSRTELQIDFTYKSLRAAFLCALISIGITLVLAFLHTRDTIVSYKRNKNRKNHKNLVISFLVGLAFLGISLYEKYRFNIQQKATANSLVTEGSLDPLLFCSSIFFIIGIAFMVISIYPIIIQFIFQLGKKWWRPSAYASFQKVIKGSDNQGFIILFLILTVSLGIFDASLARTINGNEEDRIVYSQGADLVLKEKWDSNEADIKSYIQTMKAMGQEVNEKSLDIYYIEPDFKRYIEQDSVEKATKVYVNENIEVPLKKGSIKAKLMGINTKEFGETAYFKTSLLDKHWYYYLNELGKNEDGVLVSENFRDLYDYKIGDTITYSDDNGFGNGKICGFVSYWPSYKPVTKEVTSDGTIQEVNQFIVISNLSKVQSVWGIRPYEIWMRVQGSTSFIYDFAKKNNIAFESFHDLSAEIIDKNNDPFFQGTNGVLTLGFIIILVISAVGFLIFWILSIISRSLQFGVFRAMGMTLEEMICMLLQEQFFLSLVPIFIGIGIGNYVSKLFVPVIQIAYTSSEQIIPLETVNQLGDQIRVLFSVFFVGILCMSIIGKLITDLKITQSLKLGED